MANNQRSEEKSALSEVKMYEERIEQIRKASQGLSGEQIYKIILQLTEARANAIRREQNEAKAKIIKQKEEKDRKERERIDKAVEESTSMELPLDYENLFASDERAYGVHVECIADGLIASLTGIGKVDIEYIATITGETHKKIIQTLKGSIYQNPETWGECFYKGWETAEQYLSGNLVKKFNEAQMANAKYKGIFEENIKALRKLLPNGVLAEDIFVTIGSPWVPADVIDEFVCHVFGKNVSKISESDKVVHDELTGTWDVPNKNRYLYNPRSTVTFGTPSMPALYILEKTLNMRTVAVYTQVPCSATKSGVKSVINKAETAVALEKQKALIDEFQSWIWKDKDRKERLLQIYEERYYGYKKRRFDGSFLTFPGMSNNVTLYPYQKDAVARILFSQNVLLAHDVGSGKTYEMIAAGMELRRMKLSRKNLYVVPNNLIGQWEKIFLEMYPNAKLKIVQPKNFIPSKRESVLHDIKTGDYDGIIMAYSCFEMIPLSFEYYKEKLEKEKDRLETIEKNRSKATSGIRNAKKRVNTELLKVAEKMSEPKNIIVTTFDELGITRLFVDEAHNFKNVPVQTKANMVLGLSVSGSVKCKEMYEKVRFVQKDGGVIFATGTPITNSLTDVFVMQKYLQGGELELLDLQSFDSWIGMFAERKSEFEIDVDTSSYRLATRFSKFHNLPELTSILSSIADFHCVKSSEELPDFKGYKDCLIPKTKDFADYLKLISHRAEAVRNGQVSRKDDNMLLITTDGRKAALDIRLVDALVPVSFNSKVYSCADKVYEIYDKYKKEGLTQLVFCDTSTPKNGFNVYDELKRILISYGVNPTDVAYVHDATDEKKRNELFKKMQKGQVRILIGSTFKLGLGVNVQNKLIAVHHLDIPWRPADMVQREGRIIRPGNTNKEIFIYRYITEGSFDAYSWQLLESKQNFISAILSGSMEDREMSDVQDSVLNYAEVKALAVGNPKIKERVETANELSRLRQIQAKSIETHQNLLAELAVLPKEKAEISDLAKKCESDSDYYSERKRLSEQKRANEVLSKEQEKALKAESVARKKAFNEKVFSEVTENELKPDEKVISKLFGFDVVLPSNMLKEHPFIYLRREGKYTVELGESENGVYARLKNLLEDLPERLERLKTKLSETEEREKRIKEELSKKTDYIDQIKEISEKLKKIDKELGVANE